MRFVLAVLALLWAVSAASAAFHGVVTSGGGSSTPFTALHTFFMAPTTASPAGSDSNNGTSAATPWATPNHALNCGDVIIAAPSTAYTNYQSWGTVSNCPSTTGGIDGTGGVYFATLLCGGTLGSCSDTQATSAVAFRVNSNNWAVEGFSVNSGATRRAFEGNGCSGLIHHIAFINDVSANNLEATDTNDCGAAQSSSVPSVAGVDYFATVGLIAQNSAQDPICLAAIDVVAPGVLDTNSGTHYFIYGNFAYAQATPSNCQSGGSNSDVEDYMADTWDQHNANTQGIFANNIGYDAARMCIQTFWQQKVSNTPTIKIYNNTCFQNNVQTSTDNYDGEINIAVTGGTLPWAITIQNNAAYQPLTLSGGGHKVAALALYANVTTLTNGGTGNENFLRANNSACGATSCNSTFDSGTFGASAQLGTNIYTNPAFTNTTDLLANQIGAPNCTGFATTTACMGWNANTTTLTTPSVISDLVPTASGSSTKGYQLPSLTCATNADYPTWLKGIVYLQWSGTSLTENADLVTKPCGM